LKALQRAVDLGFKNFKSVETDPDLENLRRNPKFEQWWKPLKDIS
jgi:aryl carrier-like protein